jgi:hypothetical protein
MWIYVAALSLNLVLISAQPDSFHKEVEEAKEGAPPHITDNASYFVWKNNNFTEVIKGSNEFTCLVLRDPQGRYEPSCLNEAAMKSVFPVYLYQTQALYEGKSIHEIYAEIEAHANTERFPVPEPGALVYMMSPKNKFYNHWDNKLIDIEPHIMLYYPTLKAESLGFTTQGLPGFYDEYPHLSVIHIHTNTH